ncbi:hypothetical protein ACFWP3_13515 [Streptomyces sp. NPDC058525]|uniref:hypothetical protein n=1 Tax=Streptomyces sp. NPDC058525 TaxID=3346538 RepID=UPI0036471B93
MAELAVQLLHNPWVCRAQPKDPVHSHASILLLRLRLLPRAVLEATELETQSATGTPYGELDRVSRAGS